MLYRFEMGILVEQIVKKQTTSFVFWLIKETNPMLCARFFTTVRTQKKKTDK